MEWYVPMTIIPGIGLIILSTSNIMLSLNNEITQLISKPDVDRFIVKAKLSQLKKLSISIVFQYIGVQLFLISGIAKALDVSPDVLAKWSLLVGVVAVSVSIMILLMYSVRAVAIRQRHLGG